MKKVLIDFRTSEKSINTLKGLGYQVIKTAKINDVAEPICGHPDIVLCKLSEHDIVINTEYCGSFLHELRDFHILHGTSSLKAMYPYDVAYNCARVGKHLICKEKYTDSTILNYCREHNVKVLDTNQGYAKCSVCIISDNAVITSDKSIYECSKNNGIDVLVVENDGIALKGYKNGFFGGASGLLEKDLLAVNGDIKLHKDYKTIVEFCKKYGVSVLSLSDEHITDIGSIIRL